MNRPRPSTELRPPPTRALTGLLLACCFVLAGGIGSRAQVYEKVFSFTNANAEFVTTAGAQPFSGLIRASDGNFYGTTYYGGAYDKGTVFKMTPAGVVTTLVEFTGNGATNIGSAPRADLVQGSDGNFYGTTNTGGVNGWGTVFKVTPAGVLTTLVDFTHSGATNRGGWPQANLVQASDGSFYGTTSYGGTGGVGTVFKMTPAGVLTTLVEFTGNGASNKGSYPICGVVLGNDGNYYGVTQGGGAAGFGTAFRMTPAGVLTTLLEFSNNGASNKGRIPWGGLLLGADGNFYGTTYQGGATDNGTVFRMTPAGVLTTLVEFTGNGASNKGKFPSAALKQMADGTLYGTTATGGANDFGTVFKMTTGGVLTTLVEFTGQLPGAPGRNAVNALVLGGDGNLYGTTTQGGAYDMGTAFKLTPAGARTTVVDFTGPFVGIRGSHPFAGLTLASDGNYYGTTRQGGTTGNGVAFRFTPGGVCTVLAEFSGTTGPNKGSSPESMLLQGPDGNLYGTTSTGGATGNGTLFKLTLGGVLTTLVEFTGTAGANKGTYPYGGLAAGSDGNFYGTTAVGGSSNLGTAYKVTPAGVLTTLLEFTGNGASNKGSYVYGRLFLHTDGNFYGTTSSGGTLGYGTVFKMTPAGVLTTLVNFSSNGASNRGATAQAGLMRGTDGNFYGTTQSGGAAGIGTVYRMTPAGALTTLVEFTGNSGANRGTYPNCELVQGTDGLYYGGTAQGGLSNKGTLFKMTSAGVLTTLTDFSDDQLDAMPFGKMIPSPEGNLYGTSSANNSVGHGGIFRLIFPGAPEAAVSSTSIQSNSAAITARVNARGSATTSSIEYGTDGINFPTIVPLLPSPLTGYLTTSVEATLGALTKGNTYYYRVRATSSAGTTLSPVASFTTLAEPVVTIGAASSIAPASAQLNGTVNARNYSTDLYFEYGTDGNTFPNQVAAVPGTVTGSAVTPVSAPVAGLVNGTTYYFRLHAASAGGTTISGAGSFTTLTNPVCAVGPATAVTASSALLNGSVNAKGATTAVTFEYGSDGINFPNSIGATPPTVNGNSATAVSATVTGLSQGATYYYRVKGTSAGGVGVSTALPLTLDILSGFARTLPSAPPPAQGFVFVNLIPSGIASGWRFAGEQLWRPPGVPVGGLATGDRDIEYRPVPGYIQPLRETISVISGGAATVVTGEYFPTSGGAAGGLSVVLKPTALADLAVPVAQRAQWRLLGESDAQWRNTGTTITGLSPGIYLVECKPVAGRTPPPPISVPVQAGQTRVATATYTLTDASAGTPPSLLPFESVNANPALPYAFVGQIRNDVGSATGFVVKARVVATAAHVVFDDGTLSYVTGLQWLFQRYAGTYEPKPQIPRGFYVFNGYAAQRTTEATPGVSSPQSQNLDAAALYFLEDAGRGGFGGYLGSDSDNNEFLISARLKMLVGYPIDGIAASNQGKLHATPAGNATFAQAYAHTFTTSDLRSVGGNSGGPLCVQFDDGNYYPAAIYLGGSAQTVVRSIDSGVIDLFNRAEVSGNGGGNNTSGGISQVNTPISGAIFAAAAIKVDILPAAAALGGATWKLSPTGSAWDSGVQLNTLAPGDYTLNFTPAPGFLTPGSTLITLTAGNLSSVTQTYDGIITQPLDLTIAAGANATFTVGVSGTPTGYQWRRNGNDLAGATGISYTRTSVTTADNGSNYSVVVTWSDGSQTSSAAALSVNAGGGSAPSITTQPVNQTVPSGLAVSFTVGASGATYQWQRSVDGGTTWTNLANDSTYAGVTTATLTISVTNAAFNGYKYRCIASNANGNTPSQVVTLTVLVAYDFNGDGHPDLLWRNTSTGDTGLWFMNGNQILAYSSIGAIAAEWKVAGIADFNGDGHPDLLWRNTSTGDTGLWLMNGNQVLTYSSIGAIASEWQVAGAGDFNGDGRPDLLWRNTLTGDTGLWFMTGVLGNQILGYSSIGGIASEWQVAGIADFNGDGHSDLLWRNISTGDTGLWLMNGNQILAYSSIGGIAAEWQVALIADFNGDGHPDLLWRNTLTGDTGLWFMTGPLGNQILGYSSIGAIAAEWQVQH